MMLIAPNGLLVESTEATAGHPTQAFALTLSGNVIEDMIACVQNGGDIQLSLGSTPKFLFDNREVRIPKSPDPSGYDLLRSDSEAPSSAFRLPNPTMSILKAPKLKQKPKATAAAKVQEKGDTITKTSPARGPVKPSTAVSKVGRVSGKDPGSQEKLDDAIENLKSSLARVEADKRENSAVVVGGLISSKGGRVKSGKRLLEAQAASRSLPPSPSLGGIRSPSLAPGGNSAQERAKQQRFPIIHELAAQESSTQDLLAKWTGGTEEEFHAALKKVADFDEILQKWVLKKLYWKELDVFNYDYSHEEDRQKAINNAVKQYDRMRLGASDPLWQKLLPKSERGKGICLSKLQAAIAKGPTAPASKQKPDAASISGGDSEKDDSASSAKKGKGGEPMSRSSSQTSTGKKKLSPSEAQAKRLLSTSKRPVAAAAQKASSKASSSKGTGKGAGAKGGRILSKEFVTDSDSDEPLSASMPKSKASAPPASKPTERVTERPKAAEKPKEAPAPRPRPVTAGKSLPKDKEKEKEKREQDNEKDTIRAQVVAKPVKPPTKRPRDADDDDSSSSGTPLSKRVKPNLKAPPAPVGSGKSRSASDASQNGRGAGPGVAVPKAKNTSPLKSSPLTSPPTNASDLEQGRPPLAGARESDRRREHDRDSGVGSTGSNADSSIDVNTGKKRPPSDSLPGQKAKRQRPSQDTIQKASMFKQFYARYQKLHHALAGSENPDPDQVTDLLDMHDRLSRMKAEIYAAVEV